MTPRDRTATGRYRILVIANETLEDEALHTLIADHASAMATDVLLVAPAPSGQLIESLFAAHLAAEQRLEHAVESLDDAGIASYGWVAHRDPLTAIAGALAVFEADELVIATHPIQRSRWLTRGVVRRARERFALPTTHYVAERALVAA
jgi:GABA permease